MLPVIDTRPLWVVQYEYVILLITVIFLIQYIL